tara:strand:+ start:238 stop:939 length:702 start_codon:yes stop_codon:yes gene_type:complete
MKNIFKISLVLFIGLSLVVSSCKKEEADLLGCTDSTALNYNSLANSDNGSCIPFVYGCTDSTAANYDPLANTEDFTCFTTIYGCIDSLAFNYNFLANTDDNGCIYAYDIALGFWDIDPDCEEIDLLGQVILLNDQLPESIDVQANDEETLFIYIGESQVSATIDNVGNIMVTEQTASIDAGFGFPIPVQIAGSGKVESETEGYMNLTFSGEIELIPGFPPTSFSSTCYITLSK